MEPSQQPLQQVPPWHVPPLQPVPLVTAVSLHAPAAHEAVLQVWLLHDAHEAPPVPQLFLVLPA